MDEVERKYEIIPTLSCQHAVRAGYLVIDDLLWKEMKSTGALLEALRSERSRAITAAANSYEGLRR